MDMKKYWHMCRESMKTWEVLLMHFQRIMKQMEPFMWMMSRKEDCH